ncbi:hypothetical protein FNJ81_12935 [Escherichia coli]|nr:hypothetical protein FNJ81_12935 [Escherichia coli]RRO50375.1 hypothetical protein AWG78_012950 [Escherichia coli]
MVVAVLTYPGILPYPTLPNNCSDYYVPSPRWPRVYVVYCFHLTTLTFPTLHDAPRDKCTLSCAINGIHAAFHYLKKNYISGCVMTVPTGW